jgi:hypothetical protein
MRGKKFTFLCAFKRTRQRDTFLSNFQQLRVLERPTHFKFDLKFSRSNFIKRRIRSPEYKTSTEGHKQYGELKRRDSTP